MGVARSILIAAVAAAVGCGGAPPPTRKAITTTKPTPAPAPTPVVATPRHADDDPIVAARVDGVEILTWEVDQRIDPATKDQIKNASDAKQRDTIRAAARRRVLDELIDRQLFIAAAVEAGIEVTDGEVDAALAEIRVQNNNMTEAQLVDAVTAAGFTLETYRRELREQIVVLRYLARHTPAHESSDAAGTRITAELRAHASIVIELADANGVRPVVAGGFGIGAVITTADLATLVGHALPEFEAGPLETDASTPTYDTWHFTAKGRKEASDVAFRVWRLPAKELQAQWTDLLTQLPGTHVENGLADAMFTATSPDAGATGFLDRKASLAVLVICGTETCTSLDQVRALAKLFHDRQGRLKH